ncbi:hypothetical protein BKA62DRAFT_831434 [Auriculariales sp. MPI-PUGE-AT-0066]|nr:hypothetical protein BKA62DRAFT_831434 [Auriculariales sp. MPI-PUGE-AT-0066]
MPGNARVLHPCFASGTTRPALCRSDGLRGSYSFAQNTPKLRTLQLENVLPDGAHHFLLSKVTNLEEIRLSCGTAGKELSAKHLCALFQSRSIRSIAIRDCSFAEGPDRDTELQLHAKWSVPELKTLTLDCVESSAALHILERLNLQLLQMIYFRVAWPDGRLGLLLNAVLRSVSMPTHLSVRGDQNNALIELRESQFCGRSFSVHIPVDSPLRSERHPAWASYWPPVTPVLRTVRRSFHHIWVTVDMWPGVVHALSVIVLYQRKFWIVAVQGAALLASFGLGLASITCMLRAADGYPFPETPHCTEIVLNGQQAAWTITLFLNLFSTVQLGRIAWSHQHMLHKSGIRRNAIVNILSVSNAVFCILWIPLVSLLFWQFSAQSFFFGSRVFAMNLLQSAFQQLVGIYSTLVTFLTLNNNCIFGQDSAASTFTSSRTRQGTITGSTNFKVAAPASYVARSMSFDNAIVDISRSPPASAKAFLPMVVGDSTTPRSAYQDKKTHPPGFDATRSWSGS